MSETQRLDLLTKEWRNFLWHYGHQVEYSCPWQLVTMFEINGYIPKEITAEFWSFDILREHVTNIVDPWTTWGLSHWPWVVKTMSITLQSALYPWFCIPGSASEDSTNWGPHSTVACIYWRKSMYKWTCAGQTRVVQGSNVIFIFLVMKY